MSRNVYETQFLLGAKVQASMGKSFGQVQRYLQMTQKQARQSEVATRGMSGAFGGLLGKAAGLAAGYVGFSAIANFAKEGIKLASDLAEVQNVVDTTFKASAGQINVWSKKALSAYGLSELQAKQYNGTMGAMLKSSGVTSSKLVEMSTTLSGLTGDFASFYNLDHETAFEKIRSGISGETEPLKQLGINMSVANLEAFAMSQGIKKAWTKMSQGEQVLLRYNYLLKVSKDAQGDFTKTSKGYANQQRILNTNLAQFNAALMSKFLPLVNRGMISLNKMIDSGMADRVIQIADKLVYAADWVIKNWDKIGPIIEGVTVTILANKVATLALIGAQKAGLIIQALVNGWNTAAAALALLREGNSLAAVAQLVFNGTLLACPITWIVVGITALVVAGYYLIKNWDKVSAFFVKLWNGPLNNKWIQWVLASLFPFIGIPIAIIKNWGKIKTFFGGLWKWLKTSWQDVFMAVFAPFLGVPMLIIKNWGKIKTFLGVGGKSGGKSPVVKVPKHAAGTSHFAGGLTWINEGGPELIEAPRGSRIMNNQRTNSLLKGLINGGSGGVSFTYAPVQYFSGPVDKEMIKEANAESFSDFERRFKAMKGQNKRLSFAGGN